MKIIKRMYEVVFSPPSSLDLARDELEKSRKAFLVNKTHTEYYAAQARFAFQIAAVFDPVHDFSLDFSGFG